MDTSAVIAITTSEILATYLKDPKSGPIELADDLIHAVQHGAMVHLEAVWNEIEQRRIVNDVSSIPHVEYAQFRLGVFRQLLARMAVTVQHETGREVNPYRDTFSLIRSSEIGRVELVIEIANTPASQFLHMSRQSRPWESAQPGRQSTLQSVAAMGG